MAQTALGDDLAEIVRRQKIVMCDFDNLQMRLQFWWVKVRGPRSEFVEGLAGVDGRELVDMKLMTTATMTM